MTGEMDHLAPHLSIPSLPQSTRNRLATLLFLLLSSVIFPASNISFFRNKRGKYKKEGTVTDQSQVQEQSSGLLSSSVTGGLHTHRATTCLKCRAAQPSAPEWIYSIINMQFAQAVDCSSRCLYSSTFLLNTKLTAPMEQLLS